MLHGDLKTVNVLLKSAGGEGRRFVAKVADFGLSVQIDKAQTHMSNVFQVRRACGPWAPGRYAECQRGQCICCLAFVSPHLDPCSCHGEAGLFTWLMRGVASVVPLACRAP